MSTPVDRPNQSSRSSGGRDNIAGVNLQHQITAWGLVLLLAEGMATPPFEWPATSVIDLIRVETEQVIDDVFIRSSNSGLAFLQAKQHVSLSEVIDSPLDKSVAQFCRQLHAGTQTSPYSWQHSYLPANDCFILATRPESPDTVTVHLRYVLQQIQSAGSGVPLKDRAFNNPQRSALSVIQTLVHRHWNSLYGRTPTYEELLLILQLIRVQVFNFNPGGSQLQEVLGLLRTQVLARSEQAETAWMALVTFAAEQGALSGGVDRDRVRVEMRRLGIPLREPPDYREDVQRLRALSTSTAAKLAPLGRLDWEGRPIRLDRQVTHAVADTGMQGSVLVTGQPGAGKSGAIFDAFHAVRAAGGDPLLIAVDSITANSLTQLQHELGLQHPVIDVLRHWPEAGQAVLFLDAMDAARSEERVRTLRDLIEAVKQDAPKWHVVASMRQYDLRYSAQLRRLFQGIPPSDWSLPEFGTLAHVAVPLFTDEEWDQLLSDVPALGLLLSSGTDGLRTLLRSPFNVRLVLDILAFSTASTRLSSVETQGQLLEEYWKARVTPIAASAYAREATLQRVVETAVQQRSLKVSRTHLQQDPVSLTGLTTDGVLTEWSPPGAARPNSGQVTFTHHLLFDEAAARLYFTEEVLLSQLPRDRELSVAFRPSIERRLQMVWEADPDRRDFWNLALTLKLTAGIPEITRFLPPFIATQLATELRDFTPIMDAVQGDHRTEAIWLLQMLVGSLMSKRSWVDLNRSHWGELAEELSRLDHVQGVSDVLRRLLYMLARVGEGEGQEVANAATGRAARRFLAASWTSPTPSKADVSVGIDAVVNTAMSDLDGTFDLLQQAFEITRVRTQGYYVLYQLAHHGKRLFGLRPDFAFELFDTVFGWHDTSQEKTMMTDSTLISLVSTRAQDYSMIRYTLTELFPEYLEAEPEAGTRVLMRALAHSSQVEGNELGLVTTHFRGVEARVGDIDVLDYETTYDYSAERLFISDYQAFVMRLGEQGNLDLWERVLTVVAEENTRPFVWKRLFIWVRDLPETFQRVLLPLLKSPAILVGWTTSDAVRGFLKVISSKLTTSERGEVEDTIRKLPEFPGASVEDMERARDQLLDSLTEERVVEPQVSIRYPELDPLAHSALTSRMDGRQSPSSQSAVLPGHDDLQLLRQFVSEYRNKEITVEAASSVHSSLGRLYRTHVGSWTSDHRNASMLSAWDVCVQTAEITSRLVDDLGAEDERLRLSREILLEAANDPLPDAARSQFDQHGVYGSPAPRVKAASGLSHLLRGQPMDSLLRPVVEQLISDAAPEVRNQAAASSRSWGWQAPDAYWSLLKLRLETEPSEKVLASWVTSMTPFVQNHPQRVYDAIRVVLARPLNSSKAQAKRENLVVEVAGVVASAALYHAHPPSITLLNEWSTDPENPFLDQIIWRAMQLLADDLATQDQHARALDFLNNVLRHVVNHWQRLMAVQPVDIEALKSLFHVVDWVSIRLLGDMAGLRTSENRPAATLERYKRVDSIIDSLVPTATPQVVHHLLDVFIHFVQIAPVPILMQLGRLLKSSKQLGYPVEQLITNQVIQLIRTYLTDYGPVLRATPETIPVLIDVLDLLVAEGWVDGILLSLEFEDLYR